MYTPILALIVILLAASGCSTDADIYRDLPLVAKVETGMSKEQVQRIGGMPLSVTTRTVVPGTCFDYILTKPGHQHAYNVSFDSAEKVDHTSFMTCAQWSHAQEQAREPPSNVGGISGSGY
ncbi:MULTISPECIES: osmotically-inducible lipoprotein OsmE [unclassified Pseudomonas]|uniref:Osmotically-inducible lipoprotein OsmE n=1 Tax=Pseudomonas sp. Hg7Tf TaxID=3236988 RepID=A0AB39I6L7_9PSED|nr:MULTISPECIES: osmotically-inducible lipoprotein OsmE [unclassified Pseudomonas]KJK07693.1 membrane protein SmpA [Pseudomonas sp. 5]MDH2558456.1 osmotically-inducible lipoprotein OsmE [Pseudomonas sp. Hg5Tf]